MMFIPAEHDAELVAALVDALEIIAATLEATEHAEKVLEMRRKFAGVLEYAQFARRERLNDAEKAAAAEATLSAAAAEGGAKATAPRVPLPEAFVLAMTNVLGTDLKGTGLAQRFPGYKEWLDELVRLGCAPDVTKAHEKVLVKLRSIKAAQSAAAAEE
jgi:hypothetical protein